MSSLTQPSPPLNWLIKPAASLTSQTASAGHAASKHAFMAVRSGISSPIYAQSASVKPCFFKLSSKKSIGIGKIYESYNDF